MNEQACNKGNPGECRQSVVRTPGSGASERICSVAPPVSAQPAAIPAPRQWTPSSCLISTGAWSTATAIPGWLTSLAPWRACSPTGPLFPGRSSWMMTEIHNDGWTLEDIDRCLRLCPVEQEMVTSIKFAAELGCELHIVSDANSHFIKVILDRHCLQQYFTAVYTNSAHVAESGALRISPFHPEGKPHDCKLCPPNMCKGLILDGIRLRSSEAPKKRIIYIGDGGGDYCPALRLVHGDHVLARHGFPLSKRLETNIYSVKATVHDWTSAKDVERLFRVLLT